MMWNAVKIYSKAGAFLGLVIGFFLSFVFGIVEVAADTLLFCLYHVTLFVIPTVLLGMLIHITLRIFSGTRSEWRGRSLPLIHRIIAAGIAAGSLAALLLIELRRPFLITHGSAFLILVVFALVFIITAVVIVYLTKGQGPGRTKPRRSLSRTAVKFSSLLLVFLIGTVLASSYLQPPDFEGPIPPGDERGCSVLFIGLDGADWRVIDRKIEEGSLPNLHQLIKTGVRADLLSEVSTLNPFANTSSAGMRSVSVWTSISTGKSALKHGIHDFMVSEVAGLSGPVPGRIPTFNLTRKYLRLLGVNPATRRRMTPSMMRSATLWDIASGCGNRVGVIGWWLTDASVPINGYKIENGFLVDRNSFYPDSLFFLEDISSILPRADSYPATERFTGLVFDPLFKEKHERSDVEYHRQYLLHTLLSDLRRDYFMDAASRFLAETQPADLLAVYFLGPDNVEHLFWKYMEPDFFPEVSDDEIELFGKVIDSYYEYLDDAVGRLVSLRGDSTVVIICSDHGAGPWTGNRGRFYRAVMGRSNVMNSGNHRERGILIVQGGPAKRGVEIKAPRIHDIAPTILHLMGMPIAADMDGEVIDRVFRENFLDSRPIRTVKSYQFLKGTSREKSADEEGSTDYYERLKALGYID